MVGPKLQKPNSLRVASVKFVGSLGSDQHVDVYAPSHEQKVTKGVHSLTGEVMHVFIELFDLNAAAFDACA